MLFGMWILMSIVGILVQYKMDWKSSDKNSNPSSNKEGNVVVVVDKHGRRKKKKKSPSPSSSFLGGYFGGQSSKSLPKYRETDSESSDSESDEYESQQACSVPSIFLIPPSFASFLLKKKGNLFSK